MGRKNTQINTLINFLLLSSISNPTPSNFLQQDGTQVSIPKHLALDRNSYKKSAPPCGEQGSWTPRPGR